MAEHIWTSPTGETAIFETAEDLQRFLEANGLTEPQEKATKKRVEKPEETKAVDG